MITDKDIENSVEIPEESVDWLRQMIRVLHDPPTAATEFNMEVVAYNNTKVRTYVRDLLGRVSVKNRGECGFTACAIGTAALDPWFNQWGLSVDKVTDNPNERFCAIAVDGQLLPWSASVSAISEKLELPRMHISALFGGNYCNRVDVETGRYRLNIDTRRQDVVAAIHYYLEHGRPPAWSAVSKALSQQVPVYTAAE